MREINEFITSFHQDFLDYAQKQLKERSDLVKYIQEGNS